MENENIEQPQMIDFEEELEFIHNLTGISKEDIEKVIDADMQFLQSKDIVSIPDEEENKEEVSYDEEMEYFANEIGEDVDTVKKIIQGFFVRYHTNPNFYELEEEARNRNNE